MTLQVLSKHNACWLVSVGIAQRQITHAVQNTWNHEIAIQDFTNHGNIQVIYGQYWQDCFIIIDETNIFFDMEETKTSEVLKKFPYSL